MPISNTEFIALRVVALFFASIHVFFSFWAEPSLRMVPMYLVSMSLITIGFISNNKKLGCAALVAKLIILAFGVLGCVIILYQSGMAGYYKPTTFSLFLYAVTVLILIYMIILDIRNLVKMRG